MQPTGNLPPSALVAHGIASDAADWLDSVVGPSLRAQTDVAKTILTISSTAMALAITVAGPIQNHINAPFSRACLVIGLILFTTTILTSVLCLVSMAAFADFRPSVHAIAARLVDAVAEQSEKTDSLKADLREKTEQVRKKGLSSLKRAHYLFHVSIWSVVGAFLCLVLLTMSIYAK